MTVWWLAIDRNGGNGTYENLKLRRVIAQGWGGLGNLAEFIESNRGNDNNTVVERLTKLYKQNELNDDKRYRTNTPEKMYQFLFEIKSGDIVVGVEGTAVRGICQLPETIAYAYHEPRDTPQDNDGRPIYMEYAQTRGPVEWHDWSEIKNATGQVAPTPSGQGFQMISKMGKQAAVVENAFRRFLQQREIR